MMLRVRAEQLTSTSQILNVASHDPPAIAPHFPLNPNGEKESDPVPLSKPASEWIHDLEITS